jgi:hypothetical protein
MQNVAVITVNCYQCTKVKKLRDSLNLTDIVPREINKKTIFKHMFSRFLGKGRIFIPAAEISSNIGQEILPGVGNTDALFNIL